MENKPTETLRIDLSDKSPQEVSQFLTALLGTKRTLYAHGLHLRILPRTRKIFLNKSSSDE